MNRGDCRWRYRRTAFWRGLRHGWWGWDSTRTEYPCARCQRAYDHGITLGRWLGGGR